MEERDEAMLMWCDDPYEFKENIRIQGSPRRVLDRYAVDCNGLFLLEKIPWRKMEKKRNEAEVMETLSKNGLPVLRYMRNREGSYFSQVNGHLWMLREYAIGKELPRPDFIGHGWRGKALADFLIKLRSIHGLKGDEFSLKYFIEGQKKKIERRFSEIDKELQAVYDFLEDFMENYHSLPLSFNHGDFHPMNIIWGDRGIKAVIDWEFMGLKPELYDVANMVGCAGMENPEALKMPFVMDFVRTLKESGIFSDISWSYFPQLVVGLRFAWLNDWILFKDTDMMELEITYMNLLVENHDVLEF